MVIQPAEYNHANNIGFLEGEAISYISRWKNKNGIPDIQKAIHVLEILIQLEEAKNKNAQLSLSAPIRAQVQAGPHVSLEENREFWGEWYSAK